MNIPSYRVLGVRVHAVQIPDAVRIMGEWARRRDGRTRFVAVTGMHGVSTALSDPKFRNILNAADLCVADGAPVMLTGRLSGHANMRRRVCGPELMLEFLTAERGLRHFFYGGAPGVAQELARRLSERVPGLAVAGTYTPPFGPVPGREPPEGAERIRAARPDVLWVGLSTPKQETWMFRRRQEDWGVPLFVGVGAAFDIHAGRVPRAPVWMQENGLEWFYRLCSEPRRLWKRYLLQGGLFAAAWLVSLATGGLRRSAFADRSPR